MMTSDPIEAVMRTLDSGVRTQAAADLEESGCRVQTSGNRGAGAAHNAQYAPIWKHIAWTQEHARAQAATLYTLYAPTEEESNQWLDLMWEQLLGRFIPLVPNWHSLTKLKRSRAEWIAFAAMVSRRSDLDCCRPEWGPERISYYLAEHHGIHISTKHWKRDYAPFWMVAIMCVERMEEEALKPVSAIIRQHNEKERNEIALAA